MDKTIIKRLLTVLLGAVASCIFLCACGSMDSCFSSCFLLRSIWTPELGITDDLKAPLPYIEGTPSAEVVSEQLARHYTPVAQVVELANDTMDIFTLEHKLVELDHSFYLHSSIVSSAGGELDLPRVYIPYVGEAELPAWSVPDTVSDSELTCAWLQLTANNIDTGFTGADSELSMPSLLSIYIDYYRSLSKRDIDLSRFADTVTYDELLRQAMVLSLVEGEYEYDNRQVSKASLLDVSGDLLAAVINDACGKGSSGFTEKELVNCINTFISLDRSSDREWQEESALLGRLVENHLDDLSSQTNLPTMNRRMVAYTLVKIYEEMYGTAETWDENNAWLSDTEDTDCSKAEYNGFMHCFPSGAQFSPAYEPGRCEMPVFVSDFLSGCISESNWDAYEEPVTYGDVLCYLAAVDICARSTGISKKQPTEVNNTRSYEWYYTQHGTGWYSGVNCMPTIAMMATKWYDPSTTVTVEEMRDRYLPEYSGGWYTWMVAESLTENGVPNELVEVGEDILPYLDEGKIVLSQMTEAEDDESGHCFVIYGYWKLGDTIKYYVHDSDVYDGIDDYGQRPGKAMVLDGRYCDWIINRIAFNYIVVG